MGRTLAAAALLAAFATSAAPAGGAMAVRYREGLMHGFLLLTALDGTPLADGEMTQVAAASHVTSRLVFRFKDGSLYDDTTEFTQSDRFRLVNDRLVEKGPAFPSALDETVDAATGRVTVSYLDRGAQKTTTTRLAFPDDIANGMVLQVVKNLEPSASPTSVSLVVATPEPRLVTLMISTSGQASFSTGDVARTATQYTIHVDLGGFTGLLARLFGRQPPDSRVWIMRGDAPAFVGAELPLVNGGPLWRISLVAPTWSFQKPGRGVSRR